MSTTLSFSPFHSDPVTIPNSNTTNINTMNDTDEEQTYKEMIKQLAAQAPEPYGAIPPLLKKKKKKKKQKQQQQKEKRDNNKERKKNRKVPIRRMSHVENWIAVDSKESIPDEEDLRHSSPFRNFLSTDFLVLPLHMPPPSLSATTEVESPRPPPKRIIKKKLSKTTSSDLRPILFPIKQSPIQVIELDEEEEEEEEEEESDFGGIDGDEEEEEEETETEIEETEDDEEDNRSILSSKRSIPSFSKSTTPSTSTTKSYAMSSSPPNSTLEPTRSARWLETIAQLRKSLTRSSSASNSDTNEEDSTDQSEKGSTSSRRKTKKGSKDFIPMPLPPLRKNTRKRRSEATTQPRFNPETNTYTRDTRSNPDHLRMISAELNMMRSRKLSSPLKPRGFLPRRTDSFIRGEGRKLSLLHNEVLFE